MCRFMTLSAGLLVPAILIAAASADALALSGQRQGNCWTDHRGVNHCGDTGRRPTGPATPYVPVVPSGPSPQEIERKRQEVALESSEMGFEAYQRGQWAAAVRHFTLALEYDPHNPVLRENLKKAQAKLAQANAPRTGSQADAARQTGAAGAAMVTQNPAGAAHEAGRVFDRGDAKGKAPFEAVVVGRTTGSVPPPIPEALRRNPRWQVIEKKEKEATRHLALAEKKVEIVAEQVQAGKATTVDLYRAREEKSKAETNLKIAQKEKESFRISFEESGTAAPAKAADSRGK